MTGGRYNPAEHPHPGEVLLSELEEIGFSQAGFARYISVSSDLIEAVCGKRHPMTAALALKISRALGGAPRRWMELQMNHDLVRIPAEEYQDIRPLGEGEGDAEE